MVEEDLNTSIRGINKRHAIYRDCRECGKVGVGSRSTQRTVGLEDEDDEQEKEEEKKKKKKKKKKKREKKEEGKRR
jgi:hypothetical protein